MPMRTRSPSSLAHSWSEVYRRSSGTFMPRTIPDASPPASGCALPEQLADASGILLGPHAGVDIGAALRPHVRDRLFGVRDDEGPAVVVDHLDTVDQDELAVLRLLAHRPHDEPLLLPWGDHALMGDVDPRQPGDDLGEALPAPGQQAEGLHEGSNGVVCGQERREDIAAFL